MINSQDKMPLWLIIQLVCGIDDLKNTQAFLVNRLEPTYYAQKFTYYSFLNFSKILPIVLNLFPNNHLLFLYYSLILLIQ